MLVRVWNDQLQSNLLSEEFLIAELLKVIDGDTIEVDFDLGFGVWLRNQRIRLNGIDTPESRTANKEEKVRGELSKTKLKEILKLPSLSTSRLKIKCGTVLCKKLLSKYK